MSRSKSKICLILALFLASAAPLAPAFAEDAGEQPEAVEGEGSERKLPFRGFGYARGGFRDLCDRLEKDGRREAMHRLAEANTARDETCVACRSLFLTLASSCAERPRRNPTVRKPAVEEEQSADEPEDPPTPTPRPLQREPSGEVVDAASVVFGTIAGRERDIDLSTQAIGRLVFLLRDAQGKTKGEHEYMRILAEYVIAPFAPVLERRDAERRNKRGKAGHTESDRKAADELFAF